MTPKRHTTSGRGPLILLAPPEFLHSPLLLSSTREPTAPSVRSTGALPLWIAVARNVTCCGAHYSTVTLQRDADCSSLRYWTLRYALYDGWIMPSPGILSGWALPMHAKHEIAHSLVCSFQQTTLPTTQSHIWV
ncbi:hypothetical protein Forpe1208_v007572 [Fusarium oxysporum f. sp. rapae]|uniref:Uncharacterized protein n=1 Tax=Fusarium oxysporum f. sp. rapae TaxID=485398 RepID=A0A8J5TUY8_FUSOX|nr:hypothetical protein Forpe1208_v007572 [Fusarium oxysporum f. sp. rapae]